MHPKLLIIDGNGLVHRSHHAMSELQISTGQFIGGLFGFARYMRWYLGYYSDYLPIVVWDSTSLRRRIISGNDYKSNRDSRREQPSPETQSIFECVARARDLCRYMGVTCFKLPNVEGDDIVAHIVRSNLESQIRIISVDKDFLQLLHYRNVSIDSPSKKTIYDYDLFPDTQLTPLRFRLQHIICGDGTDGVAGIPGVGYTTAHQVAQEIDEAYLYPYDAMAVAEFCRRHDNKRIQKIADWIDVLEVNFHLIDLLEVRLIDDRCRALLRDQFSKHGSPDHLKILELFHKYEFHSFAQDFHNQLFQNLADSYQCKRGVHL
jgi:5'-3' exonuclease